VRVLRKYVPDPPLDEQVLDNLREIAGGGFLKELANIYLADAPARLAVLRDAVRTGNATLLASAAHALKSASGNIGASAVHELCNELESIGRTGAIDGAGAKVQQLEAEYARVEDELRRIAAA
jgi:HPt (histidine-containing phosphotransfer) domain-containing protein